MIQGKVKLQRENSHLPETKTGQSVTIVGGSASGFYTASLLAKKAAPWRFWSARSNWITPSAR
jgi:hypothetical protein